jgi:hypothetical protein
LEPGKISAFISYSWDSDEHQKWVMNLCNKLRRNGINASMDVYETQKGTVNLNQMMVKNMRENDYVIIVLTEKYAEKADNFEGGVGFETILSLQTLRTNPDKFIFITRHKGDFENAFPSHLRGYYAIDFSDDASFDKKFDELLHKIYRVPLYEDEPIGEVPVLKPKVVSGVFSDIDIPNLRRITDKDKDEFLTRSFLEMKYLFVKLFQSIQEANSNFEFLEEEINHTKVSFKLCVDGNIKTAVTMWISNMFRSKSINLRYGISWNNALDNSYNESIVCEVDKNKNLKLKMTMNFHGDMKADTPETIVKEIWKNNLAHYIH